MISFLQAEEELLKALKVLMPRDSSTGIDFTTLEKWLRNKCTNNPRHGVVLLRGCFDDVVAEWQWLVEEPPSNLEEEELPEEPSEELPSKLEELPDLVVEFVEARLGTFRRNMDFAHEQAENLLDALEEDDVGVVLGGFVQARVHTFSTNLVAISSIANKQSSKLLDTFRGNMNTLSSLLAPRPHQRQAKRLAE